MAMSGLSIAQVTGIQVLAGGFSACFDASLGFVGAGKTEREAACDSHLLGPLTGSNIWRDRRRFRHREPSACGE